MMKSKQVILGFCIIFCCATGFGLGGAFGAAILIWPCS
jgi:hypothetical protein